MACALGAPKPLGRKIPRLVPCMAGSWVNSLLITRYQKTICASQDKILRFRDDWLRAPAQAAQDDYTCPSLRPEPRTAAVVLLGMTDNARIHSKCDDPAGLELFGLMMQDES